MHEQEYLISLFDNHSVLVLITQQSAPTITDEILTTERASSPLQLARLQPQSVAVLLFLSMWFLVILLSIPLLYSWYLFANRRKFELAAKFPGPKTYPLVGNLPMYLNKKPEDVLDLLEYNFANFGRFYRVWIGSFQVAFFMCDPKDVEVLLSSNKVLTKFSLYNHLIPWLGTGLLIADGKKWHTRRKIITPTFHFKILEQFLETFNRQGAKMVQLMKESVSTEGTVVDFYPFINSCTLDIICETAMGIEFNSMDKKNSEYVKAVVRVSEIAALRFVKAWMRPNLIFSLFYSELKKEFHDRIKVMHDFTNRIINKRRDQLISEGDGLKKISDDDVNSQAEVDMGIKKKMALLDVLLQSTVDGKGLSNEDIREEVDTFMFEGHDTTTCALSFAMYAISKNPEVQKKIYEELKDLFSGRDPTEMVYSDLGELKYLELVIKETLRMYPPVPMYGRYTEEEINISEYEYG